MFGNMLSRTFSVQFKLMAMALAMACDRNRDAERERMKKTATQRARSSSYLVWFQMFWYARVEFICFYCWDFDYASLPSTSKTHTRIHTRSLPHINGRILKYLSALWWLLMRVSTDIPLLFGFCVDPLLLTFIWIWILRLLSVFICSVYLYWWFLVFDLLFMFVLSVHFIYVNDE